MARLILSVDGVVIKEYTIAKERTTIGRKAPPTTLPESKTPFFPANTRRSPRSATIASLKTWTAPSSTAVNGKPAKRPGHLLQK